MNQIRWGYVSCWLSWCLGITAARTQFLMIHDLDLLLIERDLLINQINLMDEKHLQFLGMQRYAYNGIHQQDDLYASNQLMLDVPFLRSRFGPMDLFVRRTILHGRPVTLDLRLYPKLVDGRRSLYWRPMEMVHPSQMICQYTRWMTRPQSRPEPMTPLILLPYYLYYLSDERAPLLESTERADGLTVPFLGKSLDVSQMPPEHVDLMREMARQVESALYSSIRPDVEAYFSAIDREIRWRRNRCAA